MEPVLLQHSSATDGPLAWRGIIAAATVCAEASCDSAPQNSPINHRHSSLSAGTENCKGPSGGTDSPTSSASNLTMTSGFLAALPCVMAYYSCHADSAASSPVIQQSGRLPKGVDKQQNPISKLLQADARLMLPFIHALVHQGQQSVAQLKSSGARRIQPGKQSMVQACDEDQTGDASITAELARRADAGVGESPADPASRGGGGEVLAAAEALLSLCEEQALLVQIVELLQPMSEACSTLRYALLPHCSPAGTLAPDFTCCAARQVQECCAHLLRVKRTDQLLWFFCVKTAEYECAATQDMTWCRAVAMTVGPASQTGAAALRKCDSLATILQGLSGSATGP